MSDQLSINDFETWYRCWYYKAIPGYCLKISLEGKLEPDDEVAIYALSKNRHYDDICLFKEVICVELLHIINQLIKLQMYLYKLNYQTGFNLILQKFIMAYDFNKSVDIGKIYSSFKLRKNRIDTDAGNNNKDEPLWDLKQIELIASSIFKEKFTQTENFQNSNSDNSFHYIPPLVVVPLQTQISSDGKIEKAFPPVLPNTPFLSFAASLLCFHTDKSKIRKLIDSQPIHPDLRPLNEESDESHADRVKQNCISEKDSACSSVPERPVEQIDKAVKEPNVFRCEGDFWTVIFQGNVLPSIKNLKGMHCLKVLLSHPGQSFSPEYLYQLANGNNVSKSTNLEAIDVNSSTYQSNKTGRGLGQGDIDDIITPESEQNLKQCLVQLDEEIESAERCGDGDRYDKAVQEKEQILTFIKKAKGLGGRNRQFSNRHDNARTNLQKAIKTARKRIGQHHEALAQHLETYVKSGDQFSYIPDVRGSVFLHT